MHTLALGILLKIKVGLLINLMDFLPRMATTYEGKKNETLKKQVRKTSEIREAQAARLYEKMEIQGHIVECHDMDGGLIYHTNTKGERVLRRIYRLLDNTWGECY